MNKRRGFTLMEIIIVIIVLGVLTTIALPRYQKTLERQRETVAATNLKMIDSAQQMHKAKKGTYVTAANLAAINQDLGLSILPSTEFDYNCESTSSPLLFKCAATRTGSAYFIYVSSEVDCHPPCCKDAACPTLSTCIRNDCGP